MGKYTGKGSLRTDWQGGAICTRVLRRCSRLLLRMTSDPASPSLGWLAHILACQSHSSSGRGYCRWLVCRAHRNLLMPSGDKLGKVIFDYQMLPWTMTGMSGDQSQSITGTIANALYSQSWPGDSCMVLTMAVVIYAAVQAGCEDDASMLCNCRLPAV